MSSFTNKQLRVTVTLANPGATFDGTNNKLVLTSLRMVTVTQGVARSAPICVMQIFGMLPSDMNALTVVWFNTPVIQNNTVLLEANDGTGWTQVFSGCIFDSQPDYSGAPDAFFQIAASMSFQAQVNPAPAASFPTTVTVATLVQKLAQQMGFGFENNGVTASLVNPYYPGTAYDQLQRICQATDTDFYFQSNGSNGPGTLAICPSGMGRANVATTVLNPQSGLILSPTIEKWGITARCLFNPSITGGGQIQIEASNIPSANGLWNPIHFIHNLDSVNPNGPWMTTARCTKWGAVLPDASQ